ncbi:phosphatidylinositol-3-phosphatase SAC1 isoform X7 [Mangifera indica]|uniref:phosphatidylinositol-3-phosphatase SAC1 isoform X7 n=1 Tax=Mangifera indica TaxID=29780 RepID=UPI001CF981AA|nr:phosphatidylinositol-3-phosphatase SAC1 isoform X7 [Mangifera indica]
MAKSRLPAYASSSAKIHPSNYPEIDPNSYSLEKFKLYETRAQRFYLIGSDRNKRFFRVLKIDRSEPSDLNISEDPVVYSPQEIKNLLQRIDEGNRATGGLTPVAKVFGIAGCIKFLESYYLILVTKRRQIGCICGHAIYSIDESQLITIPHISMQSDVAHSKTELRYKKLLSSVDLTKDFFFSYTYPIMQSLQKNVSSMGEEGMPYDNIFVWNAYLTQAIRSRCNNTIWTIALVHGHFKQTRLSIFGRDFSVSLISRRSRHFAGTRYLKRGVNDRGRVANDVETEQIVLDEEAGSCKGKMSSVVQMRGSIPLFWSQEASRFSPKPDIILQRYDPTYQATKLHFEDLAKRYGNPIIVLNLIKTVEKRPREMMLRREFAHAVGYLNTILPEENQVRFIHWDFHKFAKSKSANVLAVLGGVASEALDLTGFYYSGKPSIVKRKTNQPSRTGRDDSLRELRASSGDLARLASNGENLGCIINRERDTDFSQQNKKDNHDGAAPCFQSGVLRTNCIDCLDRTNVAQYAYGLAALGHQLNAMGLTDMPKVDPNSSIAAALMDMYQSMGDALAQQYGGSAAHNTVFPERQGKWKATTQSREFLKSIRRYYSNAYTDGEKQDAINLFLGYFQPQEGKPALWELDSDYYLHVSGIGDDLFPDKSEIQLKSPNWLFGQRKLEGSVSAPKVMSHEIVNREFHNDRRADSFYDLNWFSSVDDVNEENVFQRYLTMTSADEANGWYGETLLGDQDEGSEMYKHYAELCQGPAMEPFQNDLQKEIHYSHVLEMNRIDVVNSDVVEAEMEAALREYDQIGSDLGIIPTSCKLFTKDPSRLSRWMVGEEKLQKV